MIINKIIGRIEEQKILQARLQTTEAELIAIYGRRRVGKTYLIRTYYEKSLVFEFTGIHSANTKTQLENFKEILQALTKSKVALAIPANWLQAFSMLTAYISSLRKNQPAVLFFDEFPWIETPKSGFLKAFEHWWNTQASRMPHIKVVICGSAASWMIDKILNNKGGLHNRVTQTIRLLPFTLGETESYLKSRNIILEKYNLLQLYMTMGGIPHYLRNINPGESPAQIIDRLCFSKDGFLKNEFKNLYAALFKNSQHHETVIRVLANKVDGLNRNEIIEECGFTSGGTTTHLLNELEESGFIASYVPFEKKKNDSVYKLSDEYSLFYLKFIENAKDNGSGAWLRQYNTAAYSIWTGFAFEAVCLKHVLPIRRALGIEGVLTNASTWRHNPGKGEEGAQIDLLLDRKDQCINICEMKFSNTDFVIDKKYAAELDKKVNVFRKETNTKSTLFLTLITTFGIKQNEYYLGRVQNEIDMKDLFN
ncbi:MAG: AAA family ATPase [Pseudobacter sp.]|uniref:AAA family ATPase n=1 Tax=Pseudobacter sp. TaxID=2045420 RepID=UPI003F81DD99